MDPIAPPGHLPGCDSFDWSDHDPKRFGACQRDNVALVPDLRTVEAVQGIVEQVRQVARLGGGDSDAHIMEDLLHEVVLEEIADGRAQDPAAMAKAALETGEIEFSRWYE